MQYRRILNAIVPVLMLVLFFGSITISAFHNHHDCANQDNCAICNFQVSNSILSFDTTLGSDFYDKPVLLSVVTLPERVTEPFHTSVFPSHAPPQFS